MLKFSSLLALLFFAYLSSHGQDAKWKKWEAEADTLLNQENFEEALKLYNKVIKASSLKEKDDFPALYKRAVCYYRLAQHEAALKDLDKFKEGYPSSYQASILRAFIYRDLEDMPKQLEVLNEALAMRPGEPGLIQWRAGIYLEEGKYEEVKTDMLYLKSLQDSPEVELYLGVAYYNLKEADSALSFLNKAIELEPTYLPAYLYGGSFSLQEGIYDLAIKYLDMALRLDPGNTNALFYKGIALIELEKKDEGCTFLSRAFYAGEDDAGDYLKEYCYYFLM